MPLTNFNNRQATKDNSYLKLISDYDAEQKCHDDCYTEQ